VLPPSVSRNRLLHSVLPPRQLDGSYSTILCGKPNLRHTAMYRWMLLQHCAYLSCGP